MSFENNNINNQQGRRSGTSSSSSSQPPPFAAPTTSMTSRDLDVEDAEGHVLEAVEERHRRGSTASTLVGNSFGGNDRDTTSGESRLYRVLSNSSSQHQQQQQQPVQQHQHVQKQQNPTSKPKPKLFEVAQQVRRMNMIKAAMMQQSKQKHNNSNKDARSLLHDIQEEDEYLADGTASVHSGGAKPYKRQIRLGDGLMKQIPEEKAKENPYAASYDHHLLKAESSTSSDSEDEIETTVDEPTPLHRRHYRSQSAPLNFSADNNKGQPMLPLHTDNTSNFEPRSAADYIATAQDGYIDATATGLGQTQSFTSQHRRHTTTTQTSTTKRKHFFPRWLREVCAMIHPFRVARNCLDIVVESYFLWVGVPCLLASAGLFYLLDNPELDFLPGNATLSWWLLFATRQTVTLGLARMTVYVVVDGFMLGTTLAVQTLGPLLTLTAATGKGWPLITACWGIWDLILLHGDNRFQRSWLYFTGMELFSPYYDTGGYLLNTSLYTRILLSAVIGGLAVSAKRTVLALRFGRKQFAEFKPRLERILADVVLLSEIATLAEQADKVEETEADEEEEADGGGWDIMTSVVKGSNNQNLKDFLWAPAPEVTENLSSDNEDFNNSMSSLPRRNRNLPMATTNTASPEEEFTTTHSDKRAAFANSVMGHHAEAFTTASNATGLNSASARMSRPLNKTESGRFRIKDMLDTWEEPESKIDKKEGSDISIHDILKFRRALSHLDEDHPFGKSFGPAMNRDQCIASSHSVYHRLLKLVPSVSDSGDKNTGVLTFDVLSLLALNEDGTENLAKKRMLKKVFTPDPSSGRLPLLAFVQACDQIYKRLRYFRASIRNSSVIDQVLERIANALFYFILFMSLSSLMQFNPWTFMVSITSLLVSFSFALGSSISKYVEGVLLIAVRRPFDLGDRIFMSSAEGINPLPDVSSNTWFVENITLTTTTLRYSRTNEVSTVNNWSIAGSRIVNCARSPNATVHFEFKAHISILDNQKLEKFQSAIQKYVEEHPRVWDSIAHLRHDEFDADEERVTFALAIRHRSSWQEAGRIKLDRSDVFRFLFELGSKLDVHFEKPADQAVIYEGGKLKQGGADILNMKDMLSAPNVQSGVADVIYTRQNSA